LEFTLLSSSTQPFGSLIVYRGNSPKKDIITSGTLNGGIIRMTGEDALVFQCSPAKIEEQSYWSTGCLEGINDLGTLIVGQLVAESFDFNHDPILDS
jgi:hypothetical protein